NYLKKLINWRNQNPVIHNGSLLHFIPENNVYTYFRINEEKTVMVIINNNPEEQTIDPVKFNQGIGFYSTGTDVISNAKVAFTQPFKVEGKTAMVLELE
ncbi:MAG: cyclomaltodextrinase C-terminal domain-containing protein, partial [Prolixibacteraceae bacterium]|nr:cyclomaltodextrinase C-terminal domain-containing protein [Prolixibacteraceae bacterium]